jgi:hypothetical protein
MPIPHKQQPPGYRPEHSLYPPSPDVERARRLRWVGWLDECAIIQDAFVEGMLAQLPNRDG